MLKELSVLRKTSIVLNFIVILLAITAFVFTGFESSPLTNICFLVITILFWTSVILGIVENVKTRAYHNKNTRLANLIRDFLSIAAAVLITLYTLSEYLVP